MITEKQFKDMPEKEVLNRTLSGISYYACLHKPNRTAEKKFKGASPAYVIYLGLETDSDIKQAESYGMKILKPTNNIPMTHVKINTKVKPKIVKDVVVKTLEQRIEEQKPEVVDSMQNKIPADISIGNGSRVIVKFMTFWHDLSTQHGVGTYLNKVQVRSLVKYEGKTALVMDEDGFVVGQDTPQDEPVVQLKAVSKKATKAPATTQVPQDALEEILDGSIFDE